MEATASRQLVAFLAEPVAQTGAGFSWPSGVLDVIVVISMAHFLIRGFVLKIRVALDEKPFF